MIMDELVARNWTLSSGEKFAPDVKNSIKITFTDLMWARMDDYLLYQETHSKDPLKDDFFIPNMITTAMFEKEIDQPWGMLANGKFFLEIAINSPIHPRETSSFAELRKFFGKLDNLTKLYQTEFNFAVNKFLEFSKRYTKKKKGQLPQLDLVGDPFKPRIAQSLATGEHILTISSIYKIEYDPEEYHFPNMMRKIKGLVI